MFETRTLVILIPLLPLLAAIVTAVIGPGLLRRKSHWPAIVGLVGSFLCSAILAFQIYMQADQAHGQVGYAEVHTLWQWVSVSDAATSVVGDRDFDIEVTLRADALSSIMLVMVTFVSSLVAIYSTGYMHGDRGYWRFFSYVSLFVFSMTMLVSVSNFLLLYVFWEAVGVCSYLLIGFWYEKPEAAAAGKKAFLINRIGDFGFALALFLLWTTPVYGTLNFHDTPEIAGVLGQQRLSGQVEFAANGIATAICLLLLLGACGKSAQFPLHVWLPDAMEGPTPVSALIHAATMVTAGVYMVARCAPLFFASPDALVIVSLVGGFTALLAAVIALTQMDLKRVLAYSTISQLGYMFLALGTGTLAGITSGMFHLFTHAFFKALLFLGAGSVMHAMGNVIDMRRFGGLRHRLPITHATFAIGCLALAGLFPFAGFWSKDAVIASVHDKVHTFEHTHSAIDVHHQVSNTSTSSPYLDLIASEVSVTETGVIFTPEASRMIYETLYYLALITACLTAFYTFRAFFLTFYGREEVPYEAGDHAHESPPSMVVPLCVLAVFALGIGAILAPQSMFASALADVPSLSFEGIQATAGHGAGHVMIAALSTVAALSGIGFAAFLYLGDRREVEWLSYWMSFRWLIRLADMGWATRLAHIPLVAAIHRGASRIGIGWLTKLLGYVLLVVVSTLILPLLLGYYLSPYRLSYRKFFFDEIYVVLIVWPLRMAASICFVIDRRLIDGLVNFMGWIPRAAGAVMRGLQMGLIPFYGLAMVLGALVLIAIHTVWGAG